MGILSLGTSLQAQDFSSPFNQKREAQAWNTLIQSLQRQTKVKPEAWIQKTLPSVNWISDDIIPFSFEAYYYRYPEHLLVAFALESYGGAQSEWKNYQFRLQRQPSSSVLSLPSRFNFGFLESHGAPIGFKYPPKGQRLAHVGRLNLVSSRWTLSPLRAGDSWVPSYEESWIDTATGFRNFKKPNKTRIKNLQTQRALPLLSLPPRKAPTGWSAGGDFEGDEAIFSVPYFSLHDSDVRQDGKTVRWVGERRLGRENEALREFLWFDLNPKTQKWSGVTRRQPGDSLASLLPSSLSALGPRAWWPMQTLKAWKGRSLIERVVVQFPHPSQRQGSEVIALVLQTPHAKPRLLTWAARKDGETWRSDANGKIVRQKTISSAANDLLFDVDLKNNSVIYLLNGQVFRLKMP